MARRNSPHAAEIGAPPSQGGRGRKAQERQEFHAATEREQAMLADLEACAEVIGGGTVFGVTLRRNIEAYKRELAKEAESDA